MSNIKEISVFWSVFFLLIGSESLGQAYEFKKVPGSEKMLQGAVLENSDLGKQKNGFYARLVITDDSTVFERWNTPSKKFSFTSMSETLKGNYFYPLVVFGGAKTDVTGNAKVSYVLRILKPNGEVYFEKLFQAWDKKLKAKTMQLTENYLQISMDPPDPFGEYIIEAFVRDELAMIDLPLKGRFKLVEKLSSPKEALLSDAKANEVLTYFYRDKRIDQIPALLQKLSKQPGFLDQLSHLKFFFAEVYRKYPEAIEAGSEVLERDSTFFEMFLDAVWLSGTSQANAYLQQVERKDMKYVSELLGKKPTDPLTRDIRTPRDLDIMWAGFMASGNEDYVQKISRFAVAPTTKPSKDMDRWSLYGAAKWSLTANKFQHERVAQILHKLLVEENDAQLKKALKEIIQTEKSL